MDVKLINPFIEATLHVLETIASTGAKARRPFLKKDQVARGDVSGVIRLTGEAMGMICVSFTEKSILTIVSNMFGEEMKELNEEIKDAVITKQPIIAIPFDTDNGEFTIEVCFEE